VAVAVILMSLVALVGHQVLERLFRLLEVRLRHLQQLVASAVLVSVVRSKLLAELAAMDKVAAVAAGVVHLGRSLVLEATAVMVTERAAAEVVALVVMLGTTVVVVQHSARLPLIALAPMLSAESHHRQRMTGLQPITVWRTLFLRC